MTGSYFFISHKMEDKHSDFHPLLSCLHEPGSLLPAWDTLEPAPATSPAGIPLVQGPLFYLTVIGWLLSGMQSTVLTL